MWIKGFCSPKHSSIMAHWVPRCRNMEQMRGSRLRFQNRPSVNILKAEVLRLVSQCPNGIALADFGQHFLETLGYMVDPQDYGFAFWVDFIESFDQGIAVKDFDGELYVVNADDSSYKFATPLYNDPVPGSFSSHFPRQIKQVFFQILAQNEHGVWASMLSFKFEEVTGRGLDIRQWGMFSILQLIFNLPDVFRTERCEGAGDYLLFDARYPHPELPEENNQEMSPRGAAAPMFPPELRKRIVGIIARYQPGGILMNNFLQEYEIRYRERIQPMMLGFDSLVHLLESLRDEVEISYLEDEVILLRVLPRGPVRGFEQRCGPRNNARFGHLQVVRNFTPDDTVHQEYCIPKQTLTTGHDFRKYMAIYVSYIVSPSSFWIQLRGKATSVQLDVLMDEINTFYNSERGERYVVPPGKLSHNLILAVRDPEDTHWYRAVITGTDGSSDKVQVILIDFGSSCEVLTKELRLLRMAYASLPAQALQAELACIEPLEGYAWSQAAIDRFKSLVKTGTAIMALIEAQKSNAYSLCLCDTSSDADLHVNDLLVVERHAKMRDKPGGIVNLAMQPIGNWDRSENKSTITVSDDEDMTEDQDLQRLGPNLPSSDLVPSDVVELENDDEVVIVEEKGACGWKIEEREPFESKVSTQEMDDPWFTWRR